LNGAKSTTLRGLVGVVLLAIAKVMNTDVTALGPVALLVVPISLNGLFLAGCPIVKGFDERALAPSAAPTSTAVPAGPAAWVGAAS
jgi:hypothetical protein